MAVILMKEDATDTPKKDRVVTIYKNEVYRDIDLYTHKHVDASGNQDLQVRNAVSADSTEDVDGAVIARNVSFWEAKMRRKLLHSLAEKSDYTADDILTLNDEAYVYNFRLKEDFDDNLLQPLADHMHRFLVWGALFDWYSALGAAGANQAAVYKQAIKDVEDEMDSILRGPSIAKRPMQPFGPAYKFR